MQNTPQVETANQTIGTIECCACHRTVPVATSRIWRSINIVTPDGRDSGRMLVATCEDCTPAAEEALAEEIRLQFGVARGLGCVVALHGEGINPFRREI